VKKYFPSKRKFLQEPHGVTSQKTAFFIVTAVKTSKLTPNEKGWEDREWIHLAQDCYKAEVLFDINPCNGYCLSRLGVWGRIPPAEIGAPANRLLHTTGNIPTRTQIRDIHVTFQIPQYTII
jgi:hypothetical protein